jgi:HD superfamily phosphohydrolase
MRIRDPIHGTITLGDEEKTVLDSPFYQRLRHIKQLGFGDLAFPGATHTRHAHSLGAMHVATRLFDAVAARAQLSRPTYLRFRAAVRLAVLCHDLGHMPLSHASESIAPPRKSLNLPEWLGGTKDPESRLASHEDFTAKILLDSSLTPLLQKRFEPMGVTAEGVVSLITGADTPAAERYIDNGLDWTPLLRALVSGELDADRMDYLQRDSFYTGVHYGKYDLDWILQNLSPASKNGQAQLALSRAAVFAFEDFLLSRYHMFLSVYYHHIAVNYDTMLRRYYEESPGEFEIPSDPDAFLHCDDVALAIALRKSKNRWAQRIVQRQGFKLVAQFTERDEGYDLQALTAGLSFAGVEHFAVSSQGTLSKYVHKPDGPTLQILDVTTGRLTEVAQYTPLYERYSQDVLLTRVYVRPDQKELATKVLSSALRSNPP